MEVPMERIIEQDLKAWKLNRRRKPLLLLGVRQCGKTYVLKSFGRKEFASCCYINFESSSKYHEIFEYDFDVNRILKEIEFLENTKIIPGETLLIFDEIQECPKAITALKYFQENMPELHLACAGSLLGVELKEKNISFPVGKVNRMTMYPLSFKEFLSAMGEGKYIDLFSSWPIDREIPELYTTPLTKLLRQYYTIGGMPEAVQDFIDHHDYDEVKKIQDDILSDYADDFSKHVPLSDLEKVRLIWDSVPVQLSKENNKFVFSHVKEGKRAHELESSLQWLRNAGLIEMLELVSNPSSPLSAYADKTYFKVYLSDVGLLNRRLGLSYRQILEDDISSFKGAISENFVLNELIKQGKSPYFWRSGNTAELDFLFEEDSCLYPVEVKASDNTQAKSYRQFLKKYPVKTGYKFSLKNIAINKIEEKKTISLPLYLIWNMDFYR